MSLWNLLPIVGSLVSAGAGAVSAADQRKAQEEAQAKQLQAQKERDLVQMLLGAQPMQFNVPQAPQPSLAGLLQGGGPNFSIPNPSVPQSNLASLLGG